MRGLGRMGLLALALAPFLGHAAMLTGRAQVPALVLAAAQLAGVAALAGLALGRHWLAWTLPVLLLGGLALVGWQAPAQGLRFVAGAVHALAYGTLLWLFGASLGAGRLPMVTGFAQRMNPRFHAGMLGYTRAVTWAWTLLFAAQLLASAGLAWAAPMAWLWLVNLGHVLPLLLLALLEYALRRHRFGAEGTSLRTMLRAGLRRQCLIGKGAQRPEP